MKRITLLLTSLLYVSTSSTTAFAGTEGGLVEQMSHMQYFLHKTGLSLDAENLELVRFYTHELEESIEALEQSGMYKKYPIGDLTKSMLSPGLKKLEDSIKSGNLKMAWPAYEGLIGRCNSCHQATNHGYIIIKYDGNNPYMQTFKPLK